MTTRIDNIRDFMVAQHQASMPILESLGEADWEQPVYSTESAKWTVRDIIAHLADSERGLLGQLQRLAAGGQTIPPDFDLDRWNKRIVEKRAGRSVAEHLAEIRESFDEALRFLANLSDADLDRTGRHPRGDEPSTEEALLHIARHRAVHAADIEAALARRAS